jgi:hypothetical protein
MGCKCRKCNLSIVGAWGIGSGTTAKWDIGTGTPAQWTWHGRSEMLDRCEGKGMLLNMEGSNVVERSSEGMLLKGR